MASAQSFPAQIGFGSPRYVSGVIGSDVATLVPLKFLQNFKKPIPILISGASQVTFTLNASATAPVALWVMNDFFYSESTLAYTWVTGAVNTVIASTGVITANQSAATGVWYFYLVVRTDTNPITVSILPSQTAPVYADGVMQCGALGHPGTTRTVPMIYVGFQVCTSATGAGTYTLMVKTGYTYQFPSASAYQTGAAAGQTFASVDMSAVLPKHGVTAGGFLTSGTTGAGDGMAIANDANAAGEMRVVSTAAAINTAPFSGFPVNASAAVFTKALIAAAGSQCDFTSITDLV